LLLAPHRFGTRVEEFHMPDHMGSQSARRAVATVGMLPIPTQQIPSLANIEQVLTQRHDHINGKEFWIHVSPTLNPVINPPVADSTIELLRNLKVVTFYIGDTPSFVNSARAWSGF
jgi:hypothetical protein